MNLRSYVALTVLALAALLGSPLTAAEKILPLAANDVIYDPHRGLLYASIGSLQGEDGNSVAVVDPLRGLVLDFVSVGVEPNALAISDDGSTLYVALDGEGAIRRLDLETMEPEARLVYHPSGAGCVYAEDIEVRPGQPQTVAAAMANFGTSPRHLGVVVFEGTTKLPKVTPDHTGSNRIEFSAQSDRLYGYNNETTDFGFRTMRVDAAGVEITSTAYELIFGFGVDIEFAAGHIYATSGEVIDPAALVRLGDFHVGEFAHAVLPEPERDRVLFLHEGSIGIYQLSTFGFQESQAHPVGVSGFPSSLVRWGDDGLAFVTEDRQLVLMSEGPIGGAPPEPAGDWLRSSSLPLFEAKVRINDEIIGRGVADCIVETLCVSGALAGRPEVFIKVIGPRPNGYLWTQASRFTPSKVEIWLRRIGTQDLNYYVLPLVPAGADDLSGIQDRDAFLP